MTFNPTPRRKFNAAQRAAFLLTHQCTCWWCGALIVTDEWDIEHILQREFFEGKDADADANLAPIHRSPCHKLKTRADAKARAKSNRIRRNANPETRRKSSHPIRNPGRPIQSRGFPKSQRSFRP